MASSRYGPSAASARSSYAFPSSSSSSSTPSKRYGSHSPNPYAAPPPPPPGGPAAAGGYRSATPNRKGQYSASVLEELESQNDEHVEGLSAKVKMLKEITVAIGDEVRSSSTLIDNMNDQFENTRRKLRGTMNHMLRMAQRTGVGWKAWVGFFCAVFFVFWWVWI